jgi:hypothetical protein
MILSANCQYCGYFRIFGGFIGKAKKHGFLSASLIGKLRAGIIRFLLFLPLWAEKCAQPYRLEKIE